MKITVNGAMREVEAATLAALVADLDLGEATVATALNANFVRAADRGATMLADGDAVEIVSPRQGGVRMSGASTASPSPACGRRWPDEVGSDEGTCPLGTHRRPRGIAPHPALRATFSRKREKGGLRR